MGILSVKFQCSNFCCLKIIRIQAGQYNEATLILEERVELEENQLGSRPDELADVYQMMAKCKSEVSYIRRSS